MSHTRVPCTCTKCGFSFAVVYAIEKPGPLAWKTISCPRRECKNVVKFPIPQNASFSLDAPGATPKAEPVPEPGPPDPPAAGEPFPWQVAVQRAHALERSEPQACASCGHAFTLHYKYLDADAETVIWVQCPNCGSSIQVWVLEGAHDLQL
jgi:hypothetical protein